MQKPPPSNEEIANALSDVYREHFHGYPQTKGKEGDAILNAVAALGKPRDIHQLLNDLETQRHVMKAAGWSGVASLMLDAARRLHDFCHLGHSRYLQGYPLPLSDENLAKEIIRYMPVFHVKEEGDAGRVFCEAARRLSERSEQLETHCDKLEKVSDIPTVLHDASAYASRAQIAFLDDNKNAAQEYAKKAAQHLRAALKALQLDDAARSLIDG